MWYVQMNSIMLSQVTYKTDQQFLHVYREVYDALSNSVPRFLAQATPNINWQKQLYQ